MQKLYSLDYRCKSIGPTLLNLWYLWTFQESSLNLSVVLLQQVKLDLFVQHHSDTRKFRALCRGIERHITPQYECILTYNHDKI